MPFISPDARFLGVDLSNLWEELRRPWRNAYRWPLLAWLTPQPRVLSFDAAGERTLWEGGKRIASSSADAHGRSKFVAIELPEDSVLLTNVVMPQMGEADTARAVLLSVRAMSPFSDDDLAWGYAANNGREGQHVRIAIASRQQVAEYVASQTARNGIEAAATEVWVVNGTHAPILFTGYGERIRAAYVQRQRWYGYALLATAFAIVAAIAITPTAQLRFRAIEAVQAYEALQKRTASLATQREALLQSAEQLQTLSEILSNRVEPLRVLERLTQVLPDDTSLLGFRLQDAKVTISGTTANASTLMQLLSDQPGIREVRAPSPSTRSGSNTKETFAIEFTVDPQQFGAERAAAPPTPTAAPADTASAPVASASASVVAPVPAAAEPQPSGPAVAGPSFGTNRPASPARSPASAPVTKGAP